MNLPIPSLSQDHRQRLGYAALAALALAGLALYVGPLLAGPGLGFPLDDAWIHLTYARNLAWRGEMAFNPGEPSTGATSLLWLGLLAAGLRLGVPAVASSLFLGAVAFVALIFLVALAGRSLFPDARWALVWAALCALSGHLLWLSLSGMETTLFLALGLGAIVAHARGRWSMAGMLLALLVLTRPEGVVLPGVVLLLEICRFRRRRPAWGRWAWLFAPSLLAVALFLAVNLGVGGYLLPTSYFGRRWIGGLPVGEVSFGETLGYIGQFLLSTLLYYARWTAGGDLVGWLWPEATLVAVLVGALLLLLSTWGLLRGARRMMGSVSIGGDSLGLLLLGWLLAHNLAYIALMPTLVHAGRYQALNYLAIPLGWVWLASSGSRKWWKVTLVGLLLPLAVAHAIHWSQVYREGVAQVNAVHVATAQWLAANVPPGEPVAAYDIGALGFLSGHHIVDLSGLTDPAALSELLQGNGWQYLRSRGIRYMARIEIAPDTPGRFATAMGFIPSPDEPVERLFSAQYPFERFWPQYQATLNASPSMTVYRMR